MRTTFHRVAVLTAAVALVAAGCGSSTSGSGSSTSSASTSAAADTSTSSVSASAGTDTAAVGTGASTAGSSSAPLSGTLTIYAAASLKLTFEKLKTEFETENPGVTVAAIDYDGSSTLATQLINGANVDVFASADDKNMKKVTDKNLATGPTEFATNTLEIAVVPGNPKKVTNLKSLADPSLKVVLCAAEVPCGSAAQTALKAGDVTVKPVSQEQSVTAVLTKVEANEADAGIVYKTDVLGAAGKVTGVEFPEAAKAINHYPIVALTGAKNAAAAKAFIAMVTGPTGQKVLADAGFGAP